jgi:hypothetical protein
MRSSPRKGITSVSRDEIRDRSKFSSSSCSEREKLSVSELMIRASVGYAKKNGEQYQLWDVPVGQDTTAVYIDYLLPRAFHPHMRYFCTVFVSVSIRSHHGKSYSSQER